MPQRHVPDLARQLATRLFEELMSTGVGPAEIVTGYTRRRLMVCCRGLPPREPAAELRELGPPAAEAWHDDGRPRAALAVFAGRLGVEVDAVRRVQTERGAYAAVERAAAGRPLAELLTEILPRVLASLRPGTTLRWAADRGSFLSPIRGILALLDGAVVPFSFRGVAAGDRTAGHPVLSPARFSVRGLDDYREQLRTRGVEPDFGARRAALEALLSERAAALGGRLELDPRRLRRMTLACEIPGVVAGELERAFLVLPPEILDAALARRPGALVPRDETGERLPVFLAVIDRADDPEGRVRAGYERAVAGRLADLHHLYAADRCTPLARRAHELAELDDGSGLGTWGEKSERLTSLVDTLCRELGLDQHADAARDAAALLAADRATAMVRELPSLQGLVGGLYAREEGYVEAAWQAIYDQHLPAGPDDPLPRGPVGILLAIVARIDRLVPGIALDGPPTARRDPRRLRPLARGLVRLLMEPDLTLDLDLLVARAVLRWGERLPRPADEVVTLTRRFLLDQVRHELGHRGFAYDEVAAATAVRASVLTELRARVVALRAARAAPYFRDLVLAARRIDEILQGTDERKIRPSLLVEEAEQTLHATLGRVRAAVDEALVEGRYEDGFGALAELVPTLDRFFSDVLVMDEDLARRDNRVALLQSTRRVLRRIARLGEMRLD